jgi:hypothetical protein
LTCNQCGGVVAVDNLIGRLRVEINHLMAGVGRQLRDRTVLIWVLALFPILILPPLLALLMSFRSLRVPEPGQARDIHRFDVLVVIVAICNIILSVMFWRWLSEISMSSGLSLGLFFKSIGVKPPGALRSI